jgi:uncharacterized protein
VTFDAAAVANAYAAGAEEYATKFGDDLSENDFDSSILSEAVASLPNGSPILDVGAGPGQISSFVRRHGHHPLALDLTPEMLGLARQRLAVDAVCADVRHLPLRAAAVLGTFCWYSLHNLTRPLMPAVLAELRRVLLRNGRLLIATHAGTGEEWHEFNWEGVTEHVVVTYYAPDEIAGLVNAAGFDVTELQTRDPLPHEHQVRKVYIVATALT